MIFNIFIILSNHIPLLAGVLLNKTKVADVLIFYWLESLILTIISGYKLQKLKLHCQKIGKLPEEDQVKTSFTTSSGEKPPTLNYEKGGKMPSLQKIDQYIKKLTFPNKLFLGGHGFILLYISLVGLHFEMTWQSIAPFAISFLIMVARSLQDYSKFASQEELQSTMSFKGVMTRPNLRLAALHLTIIFGILLVAYEASTSSFIIVLVAWEIFIDLLFLFQQKKQERGF